MKLLALLASITVAHAGNNVLLIIADDYGTDSCSLYNATPGATAPTPNIAALAASGVRFNNAYASPVCSPTRACLMTGRHSFRTGVGNAVSAAAANALTATELTLPEVISQHPGLGIQSACFGKWHLSSGMPAAVAIAPNTVGGWTHYAGATGGALASYTNWTKVTDGVSAASTTYATTDVVNDAVAWIGARTAAHQPWVAWVAFNAPHTPFHNPPANLHGFGANPATNLSKYQAAVEAMDTEIGRLLLAVDAATTDVLFIGDNGTPGSVIQVPYDNTHAKDSLHEGGIRVPFIATGPGIVAGGRTSDTLVHAVDVFSTVLDLAGVPLPTSVTLDSRSLVPILANQSASVRSRLFTDQFDPSSAATGGRVLRDDRYKLIRFNRGGEAFYDLFADPAETTNLVATMTQTQRSYYHRLRFELGHYTTVPPAAVLGRSKRPGEFALTVAKDSASTQTMWSASDLEFWAPVTGATQLDGGTSWIFSDPAATEEMRFYSILAE